MWCVRVAFGRWDVRMALRKRPSSPQLQDPVRTAPSSWPRAASLAPMPSRPHGIASLLRRGFAHEPNVITLPRVGFLQRTPPTSRPPTIRSRSHGTASSSTTPATRRDIVGRVREVLRFVYGPGRAGAIEDQALEILRAGRTTAQEPSRLVPQPEGLASLGSRSSISTSDVTRRVAGRRRSIGGSARGPGVGRAATAYGSTTTA